MTEVARKASAVLIPVFRDRADELRLVLVVRGKHGIHGGQLGCDAVEVLAELPVVDTRTTGYRVHPFLARIRPPARWRTGPGEICGVLTPQVTMLADGAAREERSLSFASWPEERTVECVPVEGGHLVWGLTLRVLDLALGRILAGEWPI